MDAAVRYQRPAGVEAELSVVFADYCRELVAALQVLWADALAVPREEPLLDRPSTSPSKAPSSSRVVSPTQVPIGECQDRPLFRLAYGNYCVVNYEQL